MAGDLDEEVDEEQKEQEAMRRVKERMDLRHKNTGRWSKMALQYGKGDKTLKSAYHDSVLLGQELSKRVNDDGEADGAVGSDDDSEDGDDEGAHSTKTAKRLRRAIEGGEEEGEELALAANTGKYRKLLDMDFMRKAAEKQKDRAREEAQEVLRDLRRMEAEENASDDDDDDDMRGNQSSRGKTHGEEPLSGRQIAEKSKAKEEVAELMGSAAGSGGLLFSGVSATGGAANRKAEAVGVTVNVPSQKTKRSAQIAWDAALEDEQVDEAETREMEEASKENPWLAAPVSINKRTKNSLGAKVKMGQMESQVYVNITDGSSNGSNTFTQKSSKQHTKPSDEGKSRGKNSSNLDEKAKEDDIPDSSDKSKSKDGTEARKSLSKKVTQSELVSSAFAGPDFEAEFESMKTRAVDDELGVDEKKMKIMQDVKAGWGDWAGPGNDGMAISKSTLAKRDRLMKRTQEDIEAKRAKRKDSKMYNVMLSERRNKAQSKYAIAAVPHPFTSREEYERSLQMPVGGEWNASHIVAQNTKPEVRTRAGRVLEPIKLAKKRTAGSAVTLAQQTAMDRKAAKRSKQ